MAKGHKRNKQYRKKRRLRLLYQVLSFVLIVAAVIGGCVLFFKVDTIQVSGSTRYSEQQIITVAAVEKNTNLLLLPGGEIAARITKSLSYVDTVRIKRAFPTTLQIVIEECVPLATIQAEGSWWILDSKGKILEQVEESIAGGYIQVVGLTLVVPDVGQPAQVAEEDKKRLKGLLGLLTALREKELAENALWIDLSSSTEIEMDYMERFTVRLALSTDYGNKENNNEEYNRKIEALKEMVLRLDETERGVIDLRHKNGFFQPRYE